MSSKLKKLEDLKDKKLYQKIKNLNITELSRKVCISIHENKISFQKQQYFYLWGVNAEEVGLPHDITSAMFKKNYRNQFEEYLNNLKECIDAGIDIFNHRNI